MRHLNERRGCVDIDRLRQSYQTNPELEAICNVLGKRKNNQNVTKTQSLLNILNRDRADHIKQLKLIAAFRELEACECGEYIEGRHGHASRFVWNSAYGSIMICRTAMGESIAFDPSTSLDEFDRASEETYEGEEGEDDEYPRRLNHSFNLRADYQLEFSLPSDLTITEAERLAAFIITLPMYDGASVLEGEAAESEPFTTAKNEDPSYRRTKELSIFAKALSILNRRGRRI